jgi:hypothetical protein
MYCCLYDELTYGIKRYSISCPECKYTLLFG